MNELTMASPAYSTRSSAVLRWNLDDCPTVGLCLAEWTEELRRTGWTVDGTEASGPADEAFERIDALNQRLRRARREGCVEVGVAFRRS